MILAIALKHAGEFGSAVLQGLIRFLAEGDGRITGITEKFSALHTHNFGLLEPLYSKKGARAKGR